jgi:hypothetical protein
MASDKMTGARVRVITFDVENHEACHYRAALILVVAGNSHITPSLDLRPNAAVWCSATLSGVSSESK